jgi:hypothetical protein
MFLLATSFLFLAFAMLLSSELTGCIFKVLGIFLPIVGISLTILLFFFNQNASIALTFWHKAQRKIEEEAAEFDYMRINEITPHIAEDEVMKGEKEWTRGQYNKLVLTPVVKTKHWWQKRLLRNKVIYQWCLPIAFGALWVAALVVAAIR